jgi:type IV secretory pathway VirB9-like protein
MSQPAIFKVLDTQKAQPDVCQGKEPRKEDLKATEQALTTTVYLDMIMVPHTAQHYRLRMGQEVVDVWNCAFDPIGDNPGTGTTSPDVIRRVVAK